VSFDRHEIWAGITARGGSKGISRKNIVDLAGRPLIAYTIEQALQSKHLDGVYVSSDDDEIKATSASYGASIIDRPAELAADDSTSIDVLKHAVRYLDEKRGRRTANVVLLQPTTPLRRVEDIDQAIALFFTQAADAVVSVVRAPHSYNPYWAKEIVDGRLVMMFEEGVRSTRRQDLPEVFWHNGQIYITTSDHLFRHGDWYQGDCRPYLCPEETFLNIDTAAELKIAEGRIYDQRARRVEGMAFNIGGRLVGHAQPCFIIAEAGVNHNGDMSLAAGLIDAAADAGTDAIKFQYFDPENVVTAATPMADYQKANLGGGQGQLEMLSKLVLSDADLGNLKDYAEKKGLLFLCTSHSGINEYAKLDELGVPAHKVGSGDLLNLPVLKYLARSHKPVILGTGMATMEEVNQAHRFLVRNGNDQVIFLHCTTEYPCSFEDVNMNAMASMKRQLECPVGYSDHSLGIEVPLMAVSLGACVVEKHVTLDNTLPGPDHRASILPSALKAMVSKIRTIESARGRSPKRPSSSELKTARVARKSLVYNHDLDAGTVITAEDIAVKRPGTGLSPLHSHKFLLGHY
jgi:sialic acid synthase SpsE/CMP-N-acetylneuraminic acid synthetase